MSVSNRASLGVANRGIKDSKTNRRTGTTNNNNNNNNQMMMSQQPMVMDPVPTKPSGSGRFPSLKKIPTASRNAAVNNVPQKQSKVRVPPALSAYQPKTPNSQPMSRPQTPAPSSIARARPVPVRQQMPEYEDEQGDDYEIDQYADERTEDFTFGSEVAAKPIPAVRKLDTAVRMQQANNTNAPVSNPARRSVGSSRATVRPMARAVTSSQSAPISEDENVLVYKVRTPIDPRKKTVLDALCKYIDEIDEVTTLTIAKLVNDFLKRNSQQQSRNLTNSQLQTSDDTMEGQADYYGEQDANDGGEGDDENLNVGENLFEDE